MPNCCLLKGSKQIGHFSTWSSLLSESVSDTIFGGFLAFGLPRTFRLTGDFFSNSDELLQSDCHSEFSLLSPKK